MGGLRGQGYNQRELVECGIFLWEGCFIEGWGGKKNLSPHLKPASFSSDTSREYELQILNPILTPRFELSMKL